MEETKKILLADPDEMGRSGTEIALWGLENIQVLNASTREEALSIINGDERPDLVIVDPYTDIRFNKPIDKNEGTFGVMSNAISRGVRILIISSYPESVEYKLQGLDMQDSYCGIIKKGAGSDAVCEAVKKALEG